MAKIIGIDLGTVIAHDVMQAARRNDSGGKGTSLGGKAFRATSPLPKKANYWSVSRLGARPSLTRRHRV